MMHDARPFVKEYLKELVQKGDRQFHVCLHVSVLKTIYNRSIGNIGVEVMIPGKMGIVGIFYIHYGDIGRNLGGLLSSLTQFLQDFLIVAEMLR